MPQPAVIIPLVQREMGALTGGRVVADIHDDAVNPGGQLRAAAEPGQAAVNSDKNVLREIVDVIFVVYDLRDHSEDEALVGVDQLGEGLVVAVQAGGKGIMICCGEPR